MNAAAPTPFAAGEGLTLRGERAGEGQPIVLCHGLTATRRTVLHGSTRLPRAGYELIAYDARGHGESEPAPEGEGYGYPELIADLESVVASQVGERRFVLAGHSMGAHTCVAFALRHPERLAGLVAIGPVYSGKLPPDGLAYWDRLAEALEAGGVDGFLDRIDREGSADPAWRESVLRFTRERMLRHRHLDAVAVALREVPRSRPFGSISELEGLDIPVLVVASHDAADPGHPYEVARAYAEHIARAKLVSEREGESPLAWQGGRLSREIGAFCESIAFHP